ncbi:hypothetical protein [Prochlorococcus sp. ALOHA_ZT_50]|uniref:hypothetical protein n=1 Tax=Prochlorococcus sp. ALOHA_ZT_50 TaxID=2919303 RepID=UPI002579F94B|nr:hypothetical protein [Prochlorococcus sp. ALOHA_ZT_50]MCH2079575.1 hypothetical protein [Prochlorococcus sp. ALOHA_ZT_50]
MGFVFDGTDKTISLTLGTTSFDVQDLYSRWKDWVLLGDNSKFLPAFANSVGGEPLGSGQFVGGYFFLQNGWLIRPQEANHTLIVNGNLFPIPDSAALFAATLGGFQVNIQLRVSSLTQAIATGGGSTVWSTAQRDQVMLDSQIARKFQTNRAQVNAGTNQLVIYDDDGTTPLYTFDLTDENGTANSERIYEIDGA